jgi:hypothetical protein
MQRLNEQADPRKRRSATSKNFQLELPAPPDGLSQSAHQHAMPVAISLVDVLRSPPGSPNFM